MIRYQQLFFQWCYSALFQLIAAMNLCRCGKLGDPRGQCCCSPDQVRKYQERISGPPLARVDIQVRVKPVAHGRLADGVSGQAPTAVVRATVIAARDVQLKPQGCCNAALVGDALDCACEVDLDTSNMLGTAMDKLSLSARAYHRILRVSRTIADLAESDRTEAAHVAEAIQYRALEGG